MTRMKAGSLLVERSLLIILGKRMKMRTKITGMNRQGQAQQKSHQSLGMEEHHRAVRNGRGRTTRETRVKKRNLSYRLTLGIDL